LWAGFNLVFVGIATSLVALSPVAAGSGIPEVRSELKLDTISTHDSVYLANLSFPPFLALVSTLLRID